MPQGSWKDKVNWPVVIIILIVWLSVWLLLFLKADAISKSPCSICATRMDENVVITKTGILDGKVMTRVRTYFIDGSMDERLIENYDINLSDFMSNKTYDDLDTSFLLSYNFS